MRQLLRTNPMPHVLKISTLAVVSVALQLDKDFKQVQLSIILISGIKPTSIEARLRWASVFRHMGNSALAMLVR